QQAGKLLATLQAEGLNVKISPRQPLSIQLKLDSETAQTVSLSPEKEETWLVREQAVIDLPHLGSIKVARTKESVDLARSARELAMLDRQFRDTVLAFEEIPDDAECLNRLTERRVARELALGKLQAAKKDLQDAAPHGLEFMGGELEQRENQRKVLLDRRPDLAGW